MAHTITREELSSLIVAGKAPLLFEALPAQYFDDWHLPGARNMPHDAVAELAPRLAADKAAPIVGRTPPARTRTSRRCGSSSSAMPTCAFMRAARRTGRRRDWRWSGGASSRRSGN